MIGRYRSFARVSRETETRGALASVKKALTPVSTAWIEFATPGRRLKSFGAGEMPTGGAEAECHAGSDIQATDVLAIESGPEAGTRWRVSSAHRPGNGKTLLNLVPFNAAP